MSTKSNHVGIVLIIVCLLILVSSVLLMSSVPPVSRDALTHHLAVPKLWIKNGGMDEIPHFLFSYYPMNVDMLYVIPMLFGNDIIPKIHSLSFCIGNGMVDLLLFEKTNLPYTGVGGCPVVSLYSGNR